MISQIKQVQGRIFQRLLSQCGVEEFNGAQGKLMYLLWQEDEVPIADLVRRSGLAKNTLTAMLARMEDGGLVVRRQDSGDRRQVIVSLTPQARALEKKYDEVSERMNQVFYRGLGQEDAEALDRLLDRVLGNLEAWERESKAKRKEG